jgi:hypothetical protein
MNTEENSAGVLPRITRPCALNIRWISGPLASPQRHSKRCTTPAASLQASAGLPGLERIAGHAGFVERRHIGLQRAALHPGLGLDAQPAVADVGQAGADGVQHEVHLAANQVHRRIGALVRHVVASAAGPAGAAPWQGGCRCRSRRRRTACQEWP